MSEYVIGKKEPCVHKVGTLAEIDPKQCNRCGGDGYTLTEVDADEWLLERLKALKLAHS